jgi:hypothetical protein
MSLKVFPYTPSEAFPVLQTGMPYLPIILCNKGQSVFVHALVDSGSTISVLPFDVGIQLGLDWNAQTYPLPSLVGNLQGLPVFAVLLEVKIESFYPVNLAFAWTQSSDVPVILGQTNFFTEFDVYFFGSKSKFQIAQK